MASPTYKYISAKRGTIKFDLFPNIHNIFLSTAEQEAQGMGENTSPHHFALGRGVVVGSTQQKRKSKM